MEQWFKESILVLKTWWNIKDESNCKDTFQNMIIWFNRLNYTRMVMQLQHPCTERKETALLWAWCLWSEASKNIVYLPTLQKKHKSSQETLPHNLYTYMPQDYLDGLVINTFQLLFSTLLFFPNKMQHS